jgi:hypothetical protein
MVRMKAVVPLEPMSEEKILLVRQACKEWNMYCQTGQRARAAFFKKYAKGTWRGWQFKRRYVRTAILKKHRAGRKISEQFARWAITAGCTGVYAPRNQFFVYRSFYELREGTIWFKILPLTEIGFEWPFEDQPHLIRVFKREGKWWADYERL